MCLLFEYDSHNGQCVCSIWERDQNRCSIYKIQSLILTPRVQWVNSHAVDYHVYAITQFVFISIHFSSLSHKNDKSTRTSFLSLELTASKYIYMCVYVCFIEKMTRSPNKHGLCCKLAKNCSEKQSCLVRNTCLSRSAQSSQHIPVHYFECEMFDSFRHFECETFDSFRRSWLTWHSDHWSSF